ncbi:Lactadherin [Stylophora pistillata]|uniref:Lactadherin n=1 Tax=Stylophora pistillata TaxID=50429 RepID=A0A2B4SM39_STYPI|nr:Lactadherin [Stylophora pistillata]
MQGEIRRHTTAFKGRSSHVDNHNEGNSVASSSSCPQCSNSCCRNRQCLNGGTCQENCQENGKRFICDCSGFIGQICEQECQDALGMENRAITDGQISASSRWSHRHDASNARLHNRASADGDGIWEPATKNTNQWLQIDLVTQHSVTRVATQGRDDRSHWVTKYQLQYSNDGSTFQYHRERGKHINKEFSGNRDASSVVSNYLIPPITARYIRFRPLAWHWQIAMRVELYGCHDCNRTLGMESRAILDGQISASSQYSIYHGAIYARLHNEAVQNVHNEAWEPSTTDANQWLQIDLVTQYGVTRVATQGRYQLTHWVTKYNLLYGNDGSTLQYYRERGQNITEFSGNTDGTTVVSHDLIPPIAARYIRFQPLAWHWHIAMRVELYGCRGGSPLNDKSITCVTSQGNMVFLPLPLHNPIFIVAGFIIPFTTGSCVTGKCLVSFNFTIGRNVVDGHALLGHVFANVSVTGVMDCHRACQSNCRCLSFNFLTHSSQDNCQLNEENRHLKPGALIPMEGFQAFIYNSEDALGMESGAISDAQLSASTELVPEKGAKYRRLQSKWNGVSGGGWIANVSDTSQWLQIDLLDQHTHVITKIATQGRNYYDNRRVTKYQLQYSDVGVTFFYYREKGQATDKIAERDMDYQKGTCTKIVRGFTWLL